MKGLFLFIGMLFFAIAVAEIKSINIPRSYTSVSVKKETKVTTIKIKIHETKHRNIGLVEQPPVIKYYPIPISHYIPQKVRKRA